MSCRPSQPIPALGWACLHVHMSSCSRVGVFKFCFEHDDIATRTRRDTAAQNGRSCKQTEQVSPIPFASTAVKEEYRIDMYNRSSCLWEKRNRENKNNVKRTRIYEEIGKTSRSWAGSCSQTQMYNYKQKVCVCLFSF